MLAASGCATVELAGDHAVEATLPSTMGAPLGPPLVGGPSSAPKPPATTVSLRDLDDHAVSLDTAAGGKAALVSFWATWCDACAAEFDALNRLDRAARASGGVVIGVAVGEPREKAADFARRRGLTYTQLVDENLELADALRQKRLPATLVLDRQGRVIFTGGALDEKALAAFRGAMAR
jgi:peroxiredoxin